MTTTGTFTKTIISNDSGSSTDNFAYFTGAAGNYSGIFCFYAYGNSVQHYTTGAFGAATNNEYYLTQQMTSDNIDVIITASMYINSSGGINLKFKAGYERDTFGQKIYPTTCELSIIVTGSTLPNIVFSKWATS